jgi:protein-disulfide isomerase
MKKLGSLLLSSVLALGLLGCEKQDAQTQKKLDYLISKVEGLEKKVAAGGGARPAGAPGQQPQQPQRPQRPQADPNAIYSVDISGAPFQGPATAKVTIVEASEFA